MLTYEVTQISVCIPLSVEQFLRLEKDDPEFFLDVVNPTLGKLGASNIEYNGHFGPNVFLSVEDESKLPPILEKIAAWVGTQSTSAANSEVGGAS